MHCMLLYAVRDELRLKVQLFEILHSTNDLLKCIVKSVRTNDISVLISSHREMEQVKMIWKVKKNKFIRVHGPCEYVFRMRHMNEIEN